MALGIALVTASAARAVDTDDRHMIVPGERIGVIKLGMGPKEVHDAMTEFRAVPIATAPGGGPAAWKDPQAGAAIEGYMTDPIGHGHYGNTMKVFYVDNKVVQISTQSVAYVTNKGAVTRFTSAEWRRFHPSLRPMPVQESWNGNVRAWDSRTQGLTVTYPVMANGKEAMTAQEVFVHPRGEAFRFESPRRALRNAQKEAPPAGEGSEAGNAAENGASVP